MTITKLEPKNTDEIKQMSALASAIVKEHYDPILGSVQNDYMIEKFQSETAISEQIQHGYQYYFVCENDKNIGFIAFYPRENEMYLSKLYLEKNSRKKGYSHKMLNFVIDRAKECNLHAVELNVNKYNDAIKAYEKLGLKQIRSEKNDIGNGYYMDDFVYRIEF